MVEVGRVNNKLAWIIRNPNIKIESKWKLLASVLAHGLINIR